MTQAIDKNGLEATVREAAARAVFADLSPHESWEGFAGREEVRGGLHPFQEQAYRLADAAIAAYLSASPQPQAPVCDTCQRPIVYDLTVPDEVWARISPKPVDGWKSGGLLCPDCIVKALLTLPPQAHEAEPSPAAQPVAKWDDPRVQIVYDLLCEADASVPPPDEHWEGWLARRIVDALASPPRTEEGGGWVYLNEDTGVEYSRNHPITSGEVPDATEIRRSTHFEDELVLQLQAALRAEEGGSRDQGLEEAARFIEGHQIAHTSNGDVMDTRSEGNRNGIAYAAAIRALKGRAK